jgi:proteasome lid subunit RPN8/RPN11
MIECSELSRVEICGGLYGSVTASAVMITHSRACRNREATPESFTLDVTELLDRPEVLPGWVGLLGVYHSHADGPACLSDVDRHYLGLGRWIWSVTGRSLATGIFEMRCFVRTRSLIEEIPVEVVDGGGP